MGLLGNMVSNQMEKRQNVTSQAVQLQHYCTEHEQELKEGTEGGHFVMLDSSDVWGEFIMASDQKAIAKRLGMDSDGWFTIMANHTELIMHFEETAGIVVRGYKGSNSGSSSGMSSNSWDDEDKDDGDGYEDYEDDDENERRQQQKRQHANDRKEEEAQAREMVKEIDALPINNEDIVLQIKDCISRASRNTFSTKLANQMVKDAWKERENKLRGYADSKCADNQEYMSFLAAEKAKREEEEKKANEKKARLEAKKAKEEQERKERKAKEEKEEAHFKKVNRICWLTWLGLTVFFLSMGDPFDYDWYHYVLIVLASIVSAAVFIIRWMFH